MTLSPFNPIALPITSYDVDAIGRDTRRTTMLATVGCSSEPTFEKVSKGETSTSERSKEKRFGQRCVFTAASEDDRPTTTAVSTLDSSFLWTYIVV